ncbi:hypothetical protein OSTOST_25910 [Ostertagia ostertagi]
MTHGLCMSDMTALLVFIIWGESLSYYHSRLYWHVPEPAFDKERSLGILIVADPQLVGFKNENHMLGPLTRWDCDRGDNDVGGEVEPVQSLLTARFGRIFTNSFPSSNDIFKSLSITEVNLMNSEVTKIREYSNPPELKVVLSHAPFAVWTFGDTSKIRKQVNPDLILSAHDHKAAVHYLSRKSHDVVSKDLTGIDEVQDLTINMKEILELQTPTCSYRMGVFEVGYGFVRIDRYVDDELTNRYRVAFSILWIHSRFYSLVLYAATLAAGFLMFLLEMGFVCYSRRRRYPCLPKYRPID